MTRQTNAGAGPFSAVLRLLHYFILIIVLALATTGFSIYFRKPLGLGDLKIKLVFLHAFIAYGFLLVLTLRVVAALVPSAGASLSRALPHGADLARLPGDIVANLRGRLRPRFAGRSALSRALSGSLYAAFVIMAATGLVRAGTDLLHPPLGPFVATYTAAPGIAPGTLKPFDKAGTDPARYDRVVAAKVIVGKVHIYTAMTIVALVLAHVLGNLIFEWSARSGAQRGFARLMLFGPERRAGSGSDAGQGRTDG